MNTSPIISAPSTLEKPFTLGGTQQNTGTLRTVSQSGSRAEDIVNITPQNAANALSMLGNTDTQQQALSVHRGLDANRVNDLLNFDF